MPLVDLKSLVLASPTYHRSYLVERIKLLEWHLYDQYGDSLDLAEALTAIRSTGAHFTRQKEDAVALLDRWRRRDEIRKSSHPLPNPLDKARDLEEIIQLLHLHKRLSFFVDDYSMNAPKPPSVSLSQWRDEYLPLVLSGIEKRRLLRALCRFQVLNNMFGDRTRCLNWLDCDSCRGSTSWQSEKTERPNFFATSRDNRDIMEQAYRLFYGTMPPWEHEELGCVLGYFESKIKSVFEEIAHDLRQLSKYSPRAFFREILPPEE